MALSADTRLGADSLLDAEGLVGGGALTGFVAERFAEFLDHRRLEGDEENNLILDAFIGAFADTMERLGLAAFGDTVLGVDGNDILKDPSVAPMWALAHAAMYTGAKLPGRAAGETDTDYLARARDAAVYPLGIRRGTHKAVMRTIQPLLTGTKTVLIYQNPADPYALFVRTLAAETPDPALVEERLSGGYVSGSTPGAVRAELELVYSAGDDPAWLEATRTWAGAPSTATWSNLTIGDVT